MLVAEYGAWADVPAPAISFLERTTENAFARPGWLGAWYAHYVPRRWRAYVLVLSDDDGIVAVAPFIRCRLGWITRVRLAGHGLGNYLEVVTAPDRTAIVLAAVLDHLRAGGSFVFEWRDLPAESPARPPLARAGGASTRLYPCPQAHLGADWETHFAAVVPSRKHRRSLERAVERLVELGALEFTPSIDAADAAFIDELRALHAKRFAGSPNILLAPRFWQFFTALASTSIGRDLRVSTIRIDGRLISAIVGFSSGRTFVDYAPAFDPAFAALMPGHAHLLLLQRALAAQEYLVFDFSKGEDTYKRRWSNAESWNFEVTFGHGSGRALAAFLVARTRLRAWARSRGYTTRIRRLLTRRGLRAAGAAS